MALPEYKYVTLDHGKTRYIEAGSGHPVIFIHGAPFQRSADDFLLNIDLLATRFRVLIPDCVGWMPSDTRDEEYSLAYITDFVREFQDALGITSSHIIGASMGGWIAALLAYESPDRVDKAIQTGHNGVGPLPNAGMLNWKPPSDDSIRQWYARITKGLDVDTDAMANERIQYAHDPEVTSRFAKVMKHMGDARTRERYEVLKRLPFVKVPTLYAWGRTDNSFKFAEEAKNRTKGSQLVVFECGHDVTVDLPQEFNKVALDFLASD